MFYEANDHPRHAINTQPDRSNPEHPRLWVVNPQINIYRF